LEHPETRFQGNAAGQRNHILLTSLTTAYQEMMNLQGADSSQWKWGKLHFNLAEHPASPIFDEQTRAKMNVGPIPKHGGRYTVNASAYAASDFRQTGGPSARLVIDVGNWDNSKAVNHPGESGDPDSPHYRDLAPLGAPASTFLCSTAVKPWRKRLRKRSNSYPKLPSTDGKDSEHRDMRSAQPRLWEDDEQTGSWPGERSGV